MHCTFELGREPVMSVIVFGGKRNHEASLDDVQDLLQVLEVDDRTVQSDPAAAEGSRRRSKQPRADSPFLYYGIFGLEELGLATHMGHPRSIDMTPVESYAYYYPMHSAKSYIYRRANAITSRDKRMVEGNDTSPVYAGALRSSVRKLEEVYCAVIRVKKESLAHIGTFTGDPSTAVLWTSNPATTWVDFTRCLDRIHFFRASALSEDETNNTVHTPPVEHIFMVKEGESFAWHAADPPRSDASMSRFPTPVSKCIRALDGVLKNHT